MIEKIPMVNVTARIVDQQGRPVQRARVTMRLSTVEKYCGLIVPRETSQYTDANGLAVLRVWPNELGTECSEYIVSIIYGDSLCPSKCGGNSPAAASQRFRVTVPNVDCELFDIVNLPPYEHRGSGQVITSEVASYASQAAQAADRAHSSVTIIDTAKAEIEAYASRAMTAKDEANIASANAQKEANRAKAIVDGADNIILQFESCVIERTEKLADKKALEAVACVRQAETVALEAIEARSSDVLTEIARQGELQKLSGRNAVNGAKEAAITEIEHIIKTAETDFKEEAALFGADFEALTERAETAAKRAGCSAASSANSATRACLCAERAERAANEIDRYNDAACACAKRAEIAQICADAAATRAERAADSSQQNADLVRASVKTCQEAVKACDCASQLAKDNADIALAAQKAAREDREIVEGIAQEFKDILPQAEDALKEANEVLAKSNDALLEIADNTRKAQEAAEVSNENVKTGEQLLEAATQGASQALLAAEEAKANAEQTSEDRKVVEDIAKDVQKQIQDIALDMLTEQIVSEAIEQAAKEAQDAANAARDAQAVSEQAKEDAQEAASSAYDNAKAAEDAAKEARKEAINSDIRAKRAQEALKASEEIAAELKEKIDQLEGYKIREAMAARNMIATMDRLTRLELALLNNWSNMRETA